MTIIVEPQTTRHTAGAERPGRDSKWPLWGAAAGVLGLTANLIANPQPKITEADAATGADVIGVLDRAGYHVAIVAGFLAVACLLVTTAAWRRWSEQRAPDSLAARVVPAGFLAGAGAMTIGYGLMGSLAVYLPGGMDGGHFPDEGLYAVYMIVDFAPFMAWLGVAISLAALAWMAFGDRLVPRWIGVVGALAALAPAATVVLTGLPGFAGITAPLAMAAAFTGLALSRQRPVALT